MVSDFRLNVLIHTTAVTIRVYQSPTSNDDSAVLASPVLKVPLYLRYNASTAFVTAFNIVGRCIVFCHDYLTHLEP